MMYITIVLYVHVRIIHVNIYTVLYSTNIYSTIYTVHCMVLCLAMYNNACTHMHARYGQLTQY